jgi:hypothetical protein
MTKKIKKYTATDFIGTREHGKPDYEGAVLLIRKLAAAAGHHREHNVMIDLRNTEGGLSLMELLNLSLELVQYQSEFRNKMAVVIPDRDDRRENAEFFKAGLDIIGFQFEYFTDYERAVAWLSEEKDLS